MSTSFLTGGGPAVRFENVGDTFEGVIDSISTMEDRDPQGNPKIWSDGSPKTVWIFNMTPLDGTEERSLWVRGFMVKTIKTAAREAGVKALEGCGLKIQRIEDGTPPQKGFAPPKLFRAKVTPGVAKPKSDEFVDDEEPF